MIPEDIDVLLDGMDSSNTEGDHKPGAADEVRARRTSSLKGVLALAKQLWESGSEEIDGLLQKLGTGSRDASWRIPIGESGILDYFLDLLALPDLRHSLKIQALRLVGNSCADTDGNRARVVEGKHIPNILRLIDDDSLVIFVVPSLNNICVDYEPAQIQASEAGLSRALLLLLDSSRIEKVRPLVSIIGKTLGLLAEQEKGKVSASAELPISLFRLASDPDWPTPAQPLDLEDFCSLVSTAVAYLSNERLLEDSIHDSQAVFHALEVACTRFTCGDCDEVEDADQLKEVRKGLVGVVAELTGLPDFAVEYPIADSPSPPALKVLASWLARPRSHLQEAACLGFGNLACSDESSTVLVQRDRIHGRLVDLLAEHYPYRPGPDDTAPSAILHSAIGLLKNLAIPAANKSVLGPLLLGERGGARPVLPRLWDSADAQPQTQLAVVSLTRLLLVGSPGNAALVCAPMLSPSKEAQKETEDGGGGAAGSRDGPPHTTLDALVSLFRCVDKEPTKTEISRVALTVCRLLHSTTTTAAAGDDGSGVFPSAYWGGPAHDEDATQPGTTRRARLYASHEGLPNLLAFLTTQTRFPALRSEAWFVLALMSRSPDGAGVVASALATSDRAYDALVRAVGVAPGTTPDVAAAAAAGAAPAEGDDPAQELSEGLGIEPQGAAPQANPAQAASVARVDRENGLVLVTELLRNCPAGGLDEDLKGKLQELLRTGGEMVLVDRSKGSEDQGLSSSP